MKKKVIILCHRYLDVDTCEVSIGGVAVYVDYLMKLLHNRGCQITICQLGNHEQVSTPKCDVLFFNTVSGMKYFYKKNYSEYDLTIFALFDYAKWVRKNHKSIALQHGIEFDGFPERTTSTTIRQLRILRQRFELIKYKRNLHKKLLLLDKIICVDLNFINWVRTVFRFERFEEKMQYIPNFSDNIISNEVLNDKKENDDVIKIIIPRRFELHRGVILYAEVVKRILNIYHNVEFIYIGDGEQKEKLQNIFRNFTRVSIKRLSHDEMLREYKHADICVIPTLYSEGTSLSAIESMAGGCAVISTNIGGLGNLIIPDFNGVIVEPTVDALYTATVKLIENPELRRKFAQNAYNVYTDSFSVDVWTQRWTRIFDNLKF